MADRRPAPAEERAGRDRPRGRPGGSQAVARRRNGDGGAPAARVARARPRHDPARPAPAPRGEQGARGLQPGARGGVRTAGRDRAPDPRWRADRSGAAAKDRALRGPAEGPPVRQVRDGARRDRETGRPAARRARRDPAGRAAAGEASGQPRPARLRGAASRGRRRPAAGRLRAGCQRRAPAPGAHARRRGPWRWPTAIRRSPAGPAGSPRARSAPARPPRGSRLAAGG